VRAAWARSWGMIAGSGTEWICSSMRITGVIDSGGSGVSAVQTDGVANGELGDARAQGPDSTVMDLIQAKLPAAPSED
jgi:hypothetical protein